MKLWRLIVVCFLSVPLLTHVCAAKRAPYTLNRRTTKAGHVILRLIDRHTGKQIWKRSFASVEPMKWSHDHKALAAAVYSSSWYAFRLLIWQKGKSVLIIAGPRRFGSWGFESDGVIDFAWSPDDQRLLFRPWGSGEKDMDVASLRCFDTLSNRMTVVSENVMRMQWIGNHRVRYWNMNPYGSTDPLAMDPRPRYWNCP